MRIQPKILTESKAQKQNEIILVIDDNSWEGPLETLRKIFQFEIDGLPQPEQFFNLVQITPSQFTRFLEHIKT